MSGGSKKPSYHYPPDIKEMCYRERDSARRCLESKGDAYKEQASVALAKHPGEKKFGSQGWGWRLPELKGKWVLGVCRKTRGTYQIEVGSNPKDGSEVNSTVVKHEHGHFWRMSNYGDGSHNHAYSSCFFNWNDPRVKVMEVKTRGGDHIVVDYISDEDVRSLE